MIDIDTLLKILTLAFLLYIHPDKTKNIFNFIYKHIPLLIAVLMPLAGIGLFILAPQAFEQQHLLHNSYPRAYGIFLAFTLFAIVSFPLSKYMYKEYKERP
jgi:hypothetical protein